MLRRALVLHRPDQRRAREQAVRQLREADVVGADAGDDLVADLPHRGGVVAEQARRHFLLLRGAAFRPAPHQRDVAADVLAQQLVRLQQVVLVVLLQHAHARRLGERSEVHRRRVHRRRDVHEAQAGGAARQLDLPHVAHQRDVGVVDGDRQLGLVVQRGGLILDLRGQGRDGGRRGTKDKGAGGEDRRGHPGACRHVNRSLKGGAATGPMSSERCRRDSLQAPAVDSR